MKTPDSLIGYETEIDNICHWCSNWTNQNDFDRLTRELPVGPTEVRQFKKGSSIIGPFSGTARDYHLIVLQELIRLGLAENREREGLIEYRVVPE